MTDAEAVVAPRRQGESRGVDNGGKSGIINVKEKTSLNRYLSAESYAINEKLRNGTSLSEEESEFVRNLDSLLEKMPVYRGTVYRSISSMWISDIDEFWKTHKKGDYVQYSAYTSTSTEIYDEAMDIQFVIKSNSARDIRAYNENEGEILFRRNSRFYVTDIKNNVIYMEEEE